MSDLQSPSKFHNFLNIAKANMRNYTMFLILGLIMLGFAILTDGVNFHPRNFTYIFIQNSYILILAIGMILIIIVGDIDLSVGSLSGFLGAISVIIYNNLGFGFVPTIILTILIGLAIGAFMGYWVAYVNIPAFIVTLAGMFLFRGLTYIITNVTPITPRTQIFKDMASGTVDFLKINTMAANSNGEMVQQAFQPLPIIIGILIILYMVFSGIKDRKNKIKNDFTILPIGYFITQQVFFAAILMLLCVKFAQYRGLPNVFAILGITAIIFMFITRSTVFGRYIYAVGGNARSAKLSGINSEKVKFLVHVIMGGICGLAGVVFTGYMNSALPDAGKDFELEAIAACYIGGASAAGGVGTIIGAIMGGLVMGVINNGMSLMNIGANWQYVVKGSVLLLAVWYDVYTRKKAGLA
ncbi:MAG TPA: sugar ABC transporter permease [Spirochaetia bacterium]|nr:sugar ABC transporter permease [Spirochaetia bacterium]